MEGRIALKKMRKMDSFSGKFNMHAKACRHE